MHVLICDDDIDTVSMIRALIEDLGYKVSTAGSGYAALSVLNGGVDVVITDYLMPNGDGGMLSHVCNERRIPCVVMTGSWPELALPYVASTIPIINKIDFVDMLAKPFEAAIAGVPAELLPPDPIRGLMQARAA